MIIIFSWVFWLNFFVQIKRPARGQENSFYNAEVPIEHFGLCRSGKAVSQTRTSAWPFRHQHGSVLQGLQCENFSFFARCLDESLAQGLYWQELYVRYQAAINFLLHQESIGQGKAQRPQERVFRNHRHKVRIRNRQTKAVARPRSIQDLPWKHLQVYHRAMPLHVCDGGFRTRQAPNCGPHYEGLN